jgi:hypothetical protein
MYEGNLRECPAPLALPVEPVEIPDVGIVGMGLGRSIYSRKQLDDFVAFQEAVGSRKA